ncbi:uncharacterized protein DFL_000051 [Arthrobotrys flagrans]|uniref:Uncharacterized protein n=1 Tax=Arthrobotrys flagrans TaxID=97331 RepID=A0A437AE02_ARTFL|nr:hypothetical protein DFL_000051 [Arthrobotrys flagrans]
MSELINIPSTERRHRFAELQTHSHQANASHNARNDSQRVRERLKNIAEFLNSKVTALLSSNLADDQVTIDLEIASRLSTRGQISAFATAFRLEGLIGIDVGEYAMPLDARDILDGNGITPLIDRTVHDVPDDTWQFCPHLVHFLQFRGLKAEITCTKEEYADPGCAWITGLEIESTRKGLRKWKISEFGANKAEWKMKARLAALATLQGTYFAPSVF